VLRTVIGVGTPRGLQGVVRAVLDLLYGLLEPMEAALAVVPAFPALRTNCSYETPAAYPRHRPGFSHGLLARKSKP